MNQPTLLSRMLQGRTSVLSSPGHYTPVVGLAGLLLFLAGAAGAGEPAVNLDVPPRATQKPYSPADGQVVEVTPPPFMWVPAGRDSKYVLQVSRAESFDAQDTRTFGGLRRSVFVPAQPLPAGKWFWRYGIETDKGATFGRPRPFTVPDDARPFPFPNWDDAVQRVPRQRPRLFFPGAAAGASAAVGARRVEAGGRLAGGFVRAGGRQGTGRRAGLSAEGAGLRAVGRQRDAHDPAADGRHGTLRAGLPDHRQRAVGPGGQAAPAAFLLLGPQRSDELLRLRRAADVDDDARHAGLRLDLRSVHAGRARADRGQHEGPRRAVPETLAAAAV